MKIIRKVLSAIGGLFTGFIQRNAGIAKGTAFSAMAAPTLIVERPGNTPLMPFERPRVLQVVRVGPKIGRNEPCTCGSGQKFKKCHGA